MLTELSHTIILVKIKKKMHWFILLSVFLIDPFWFLLFFFPAHMLCQPHLTCVWDVKPFVCPTRMEDTDVRDYVIFIFGFRTAPVTGLARGWKDVFISVLLLSGCLTLVIWEMKVNTV